jgi:CubicO group peptidase (beta-lactamase class C family)
VAGNHRPVRVSGVVVLLLVAAGGGCGSRALVAAPVSVPPAAGGAPLLAPFVPGSTSPARRAKLAALAPRLDQLLRTNMQESGATGLVAGVVLDGELAYARALGVREVTLPAAPGATGAGAPPSAPRSSAVDADTVFRIASMTKSFTAMAIMKLRDDGRVSLDADASTYLPELRTLVGVPHDAPVTVRMLLTHASGLPYDDYWGGDSFGMTDPELTRFLQAGVRLSHAPGAVYAYSNLGYALLGRIVARVSGVSFRDYVSQNILRPLGMRSSVWDAAQVPPDRLATG